MSFVTPRGIGTGIIFSCLAMPALADITAAELRDQVIGLIEMTGAEVSIESENQNGSTLLLDGISITFDVPDEDVEIVLNYPTVALTDISGTVEMTYPNGLDFTALVTPEGEVTGEFTASMEMDDYVVVFSGSMQDLMMESSATGGAFAVGMDIPDELSLPELASGTFGAIANSLSIKRDGPKLTLKGDASLKSIAYLADITLPDDEGRFTQSGSFEDYNVGFEFDAALIPDPEEILRRGVKILLSLDIGAAKTEVTGDIPDEGVTIDFAYSSDGTVLDFVMSNDQFRFDVESSGLSGRFAMLGAPIPPVELSWSKLQMGVEVPLSTASAPQPFYTKAIIRDLEINESLWSMFDPGKVIPRDPATAVVDLSGNVNVLADIMTPQVLDRLDDMDIPPMLPVDIQLNELTLHAAGAALDGSGSVTFNFANPNTISGFPAPEGSVSLSLKGGFALMDKLVKLGFVPEDATMGIRAMLGAFAKPVGDDHLETKIEVTKEGAVLANGQRIQ